MKTKTHIDQIRASITQIRHYNALMADIEPLMEADPFNSEYEDSWINFYEKSTAALIFGAGKLVELAGIDEKTAKYMLIHRQDNLLDIIGA